MVVTLLEVKGALLEIEGALLEVKHEVAEIIFFQLVAQVLHFFDMLIKHTVQVILYGKGLILRLLLLELLLLEHYTVSHISDHNDQLGLPINLNLVFL